MGLSSRGKRVKKCGRPDHGHGYRPKAASSRKLLLVTGRELEDLLRVCPRLGLFDRVVAENGALVYRPATREEKVLRSRPPDEFLRALVQPYGEMLLVAGPHHCAIDERYTLPAS